MNRIRKILFLGLATAALTAPMMIPTTSYADIGGGYYTGGHGGHGGYTSYRPWNPSCVTYQTVCVYDVYYWDCHCNQWIAAGTYYAGQATFAVNQLQGQGYQTTWQQRHVSVPVHH